MVVCALVLGPVSCNIVVVTCLCGLARTCLGVWDRGPASCHMVVCGLALGPASYNTVMWFDVHTNSV